MILTVKSNKNLPTTRSPLTRLRRGLLVAAASGAFVGGAFAAGRFLRHRQQAAQVPEVRWHAEGRAGAEPGLSRLEEEPAPPVQLYMVPAAPCSYMMQPNCPAQALFDNPEVHEVVTENIMRVGQELLSTSDRHLVRAAVATGFKNISYELSRRTPDVTKELQKVQLSEQQKNLVLSALRLTSNRGVRDLGLVVGKAIHEGGGSYAGRKEMRQIIEEALMPRLQEIRELHDDLLLGEMGELLVKGKNWEMTLDPDNLAVMGPYRRGKFATLTASDVYGAGQIKKTPYAEKTYGVLGGVLEQGRALLHLVKLYARLSGRYLQVPTYVTSLGGNLDITSQDLNCEHDHQKALSLKLSKALYCPLKFGTQGLETLRAADDLERFGAERSR